MSELDPAATYPVYAHPLISWGSVILGALAAIAIGVLLNLLVAAFDAAATVGALNAGRDATENLLFLGVFGAIANLFALFIGSFIAARSANHPDHHDGMLHGLGVWALAFVVAFTVLGSGVHHAGVTLGAGVDGGALGGLGAPSANAQAGAAAPAPQVPPEIDRRAQADAASEGQQEALDIAKGAEGTAFFGFTAMLVGLIAALVGGILGARHPEHFVVRPRRTFVR